MRSSVHIQGTGNLMLVVEGPEVLFYYTFDFVDGFFCGCRGQCEMHSSVHIQGIGSPVSVLEGLVVPSRDVSDVVYCVAEFVLH